jgi:glycerol uptake facilitator protein
MNPARDIGPRLAHWVLPIRGKGPSEWLTYAWVPLTAPMIAAAPAAFVARGINHLIASGGTVV